MSSPGEDDDQGFERAPVHRIVSAKDASPLYSKAASSVFTSWRKPGEQIGEVPSLDEPDATEATTETPPPADTGSTAAAPTTDQQGEPMAKRNGAARARKSSRGSPQLQICSVLLQNDLARDALATELPDLTAAQISSALNNAKAHKRVKFKDAEQVYTLTAAGRAWVEAATGQEQAEPAPEKPARKSAAHRRGRRQHQAAASSVDTSPAPASARTFRCAVFSDGGFFLAKGDQRIELDAGEHAEMLAYLERMAEEA